jgi:hypothetical protein
MNFYLIDFHPKFAYAQGGLRDIAVRVFANNSEQAKDTARAEVLLENPDLDIEQFDIDVDSPLRC